MIGFLEHPDDQPDDLALLGAMQGRRGMMRDTSAVLSNMRMAAST